MAETKNKCCCSVPQCSNSKQKQPYLSFHGYPMNEVQKKKWVIAIRRDEGPTFVIRRGSTYVCSQHFTADDYIPGSSRLKVGAIPSRFRWNNFNVLPQRLPSFERSRLGADARAQEQPVGTEDAPNESSHIEEHDCAARPLAVPEPAAADNALDQTKDLHTEVDRLMRQAEEMSASQRFSLGRFAASDDDIRFYTRFMTYRHLMAFWKLIEPASHNMIRVSRARATTLRSEAGTTGSAWAQPLQPIDEFFLFMIHLSVGQTQRDLAHRFNIHQSTVSRIITTWANFLYTVLGSVRTWMSVEEVKAHLPDEFQDYPDTHVVIGCTELRCQTPSSLLLQSQVFSNYTSHCTFKGLIGTAPHGAVTFVSSLHAGSVSEKELFRQSGIVSLLKPGMAIMVDKGFPVDDCVPCKVYRLSKSKPMTADEVRETQSIARLRIHVERLVRRVKEHKLFDTVIPLSITGSINQLHTVACLLVNYQSGPLVKAWAED